MALSLERRIRVGAPCFPGAGGQLCELTCSTEKGGVTSALGCLGTMGCGDERARRT